jgi:hypothetical protein
MKKEEVVQGVELILERIDAILDTLRIDDRCDPLPEICELLTSLLPLLPEIAPYVVQHYEHASDERGAWENSSHFEWRGIELWNHVQRKLDGGADLESYTGYKYVLKENGQVVRLDYAKGFFYQIPDREMLDWWELEACEEVPFEAYFAFAPKEESLRRLRRAVMAGRARAGLEEARAAWKPPSRLREELDILLERADPSKIRDLIRLYCGISSDLALDPEGIETFLKAEDASHWGSRMKIDFYTRRKLEIKERLDKEATALRKAIIDSVRRIAGEDGIESLQMDLLQRLLHEYPAEQEDHAEWREMIERQRRAAVEGLVVLGSLGSVPKLLEGLENPNRRIAAACFTTLAALSGQDLGEFPEKPKALAAVKIRLREWYEAVRKG